MEKIMKKLVSHLDNEYNFLTSYLQALKDQKTYVVKGDVVGLNNNTLLLTELYQQNRSLQRSREAQFKSLANLFHIPVEDLTISKIIASVNEKWAATIREQKEKILQAVQEIRQEIETNAFILKYALNFTDQIIRMTDVAMNSDMVYSNKGQKQERVDQNKILDQRI